MKHILKEKTFNHELSNLESIDEKEFESNINVLQKIFQEIGKPKKVLANKRKEYNDLCESKKKYQYKIADVKEEIEYVKTKIVEINNNIIEIKDIIQDTAVNLEQLENEKKISQKQLIEKHNAYKQASKYYKSRLNLYIHTEKKENTYFLQICFFTQSFDDTYSFVISKTEDDDDMWKLENVKPTLKENQFLLLQKRFHDTNDISCLLCTLRSIFKIYRK